VNPSTSFDQIRSTVLDLLIHFGPKALVAILILVAGAFVSRAVSRWMLKVLGKVELEPPVRTLLARLAWAVTFTLFIILALQNLGVELLPLIAGLSVAGAGLALATQGVLSNVVAGLSIIFTKPFRVGEYIALLGEEGQVNTISLFSTTLVHADRSRIVIPNRKIVGEILHNYGGVRQLDVVVGVAYDTQMDEALGAIREVLQANPRVLKDPAPVVQAVLLADSSVMIGVRPWVQVPDFGPASGEVTQAVLEKLRSRDIVIPYPQREVRMLGTTG